MGITVLAFFDRISSFHSLMPFLFSRHRKLFRYVNSPGACKGDRNKVLFMDRWFLKPDKVDLELLKRLRQQYQTIFFFNGNAGGGILRPEVLPYVDCFFNKSLFKDRSLYSRQLYGDELYTDYYHREHGIDDPQPRQRQVISNPADYAKLKVSWNIGIGDFPRHKYRQRAAVALARTLGMKWVKPFYKRREPPQQLPANSGSYDIQARWGGPKRPTLLYHRELMLRKINGNPRFIVGRVAQNLYNEEIKNCKITLSPFGWGELCFRDFEAVLNGSLLLKPDMSHLETWPDIFKPYETYIPFDWEASDLVAKGEQYLGDEAERRRIVKNAFQLYVDQARAIEERVEDILSMVPGI